MDGRCNDVWLRYTGTIRKYGVGFAEVLPGQVRMGPGVIILSHITKTVAFLSKQEGLISFRGDVRSFGDGSFHQEDQADHNECNNGEDKEGVEVGERRGLLGP
jgi:hypothetical protein